MAWIPAATPPDLAMPESEVLGSVIMERLPRNVDVQ